MKMTDTESSVQLKSPNDENFNSTKITIKQEKYDEEIERKINPELFALRSKSVSSKSSVTAEEDQDDKKNIEPVKSSNEILAELFKVFNAAPPEQLLNDDQLLKNKKKRKKDKKDKKEKKKSKKSKSGEEDDEISDDRKHKKKKHKKDKDGKDKEKKAERSKESKVVVKTERIDHNERDRDRTERSRSRKRSKEREKGEERDAKSIKTEISSKSRHTRDKSNEKSDRKKDSSRSNKTIKEESDISLSDEETYLQRKQSEPVRNDFYGSSDRSNSRYSDTKDRDRDRFYRSDRSDYRRKYDDRHTRRRSRDKYRSRSRSRTHSPRDLGIDKKRLLEIARKNAISMFKRGNLPGCAGMTDEIKDKVLLKMRYGGKTVQDLTDFCKKLTNGESINDLSDFSSEEESDHDKDGNTKAFHHPFVIKEREPIVMRIKNAVPIPPKTAQQSKAILMQFPVSSGQEHRATEGWVPVSKDDQTKPVVSLPPKATVGTVATAPKNVFAKPLPIEEQQPAFKPVVPTTEETNTAEVTTPIPMSAPAPIAAIPPQAIASSLFKAPPPAPAFIPPSSQMTLSTNPFPMSVPPPPIRPPDPPTVNVFPEAPPPTADVSSIISKRLNALRRLQDNPMDSEAIKMVYSSQKEMTSWVSSKYTPGQFTGSTGANVLSARELSGGFQAWARKDQLTSTTPVSGGMGMHLLKKMGWNPGEGLGREKNGALQPLLLDVKLDRRGLAQEEHENRRKTANRKKGGGGGGGAPGGMPPALDIQNKHPVCLLNELAAKRKWTPPQYDIIKDNGPSHHRTFQFRVELNGVWYQPGKPSSTKKDAKLAAAKCCLEQIGILPPS